MFWPTQPPDRYSCATRSLRRDAQRLSFATAALREKRRKTLIRTNAPLVRSAARHANPLLTAPAVKKGCIASWKRGREVGSPASPPGRPRGRPSAIWLAARPRCPLLVPPERLRHARTLQALFHDLRDAKPCSIDPCPGEAPCLRRRRHFPFAPCAAKPVVCLFQTGGSCSWPLPRPAKPLRPI